LQKLPIERLSTLVDSVADDSNFNVSSTNVEEILCFDVF